MNITLRDTITDTVLAVDPETQLYINLSAAEAEAISEDPRTTLASHPLKIFPPVGANASDLYATFEDIRAYHDLIQAAAGRALLVELVQMIKDRHAGTTLIDLDQTHLRFQREEPSDDRPTYQLITLMTHKNDRLMDQGDLDEMMDTILDDTPAFTLGQLQVYTALSDLPIYRDAEGMTHTGFAWDPDTLEGLPMTLDVSVKDLLTVDQRI